MARRRCRSGTLPVAKPSSHSDLYQGIAAFLLLLIGLSILWIGGRSLADELAVFWKLERKTIQVADVYAEHKKSFHRIVVCCGIRRRVDLRLAQSFYYKKYPGNAEQAAPGLRL